MATLKGCDAAELLKIRDRVDELLKGKVSELEAQLKRIKGK